MKKRDLSDDEKELWKEFSRSTKPLPHQNKKSQQRTPEKKKRVNPVDLKDQDGTFTRDKFYEYQKRFVEHLLSKLYFVLQVRGPKNKQFQLLQKLQALE